MFSRGSLQIASISGIPIKLHWTFGLLLVGVGTIGYVNDYGFAGTAYFGGFVMALFFCVVLHEMGHALAARMYKVTTKDIILSPIGGVARLSHLPNKPAHELVIAIAGPLVNVFIATTAGLYIWIANRPFLDLDGNETDVLLNSENFIPLLMVINISLVIFNLIPAFPMDGGRVLRALLSMKFGRLSATKMALIVGRVLAVIFIGFGLYMGQFILPFIGLFIFMAGGAEYRSVKFEALVRNKTVGHAYRDQYTLLYEYDSIAYAYDKMRRNFEKNFMVVNDQNHLTGVLSEKTIKKAMSEANGNDFIASHKSPEYEAVDVRLPLQYLISLFHQKEYAILPVYNDGEFVGVIDREILRKL